MEGTEVDCRAELDLGRPGLGAVSLLSDLESTRPSKSTLWSTCSLSPLIARNSGRVTREDDSRFRCVSGGTDWPSDWTLLGCTIARSCCPSSLRTLTSADNSWTAATKVCNTSGGVLEMWTLATDSSSSRSWASAAGPLQNLPGFPNEVEIGDSNNKTWPRGPWCPSVSLIYQNQSKFYHTLWVVVR